MNPQAEIRIDPARPADWPAIRTIHAEGIATGDATFETTPPPDWETWLQGRLPESVRVLRADGQVRAWAALMTVSGRCFYTGVAEVSLYVAAAARGQGLGRRLLADLIEGSEQRGLWSLQAKVFPENGPSLALFRGQGFRVVGFLKRVGRMEAGPLRGHWRDVLLLERRSQIVGID